jgi:hypothetical protein
MNESFYKLYKSLRDIVHEFDGVDISPHIQKFVDANRIGVERYDRANDDCKNRWLKEKDEKQNTAI